MSDHDLIELADLFDLTHVAVAQRRDRHDPDLCTDSSCVDPAHLPDRDDTVWSASDNASWVEFDHRARRREDV